MSGLVDRSGHVELDWTVESIRVGDRHRHDLGDLTELIESIHDLGMLQPITVSPDGTLICGARRLAAAKQLGLRQISVWVRSGISSRLEKLLAESHDNTVRKPFSPAEGAGLYAELKALMAEEAARRQEATQFGSDIGAVHGSAESAEPSGRESRVKAARLVTGRMAYTRLEQVLELQTLAEDSDTPIALRQAAMEALEHIEADGKVNGHYQQVKAAQRRMDQATTLDESEDGDLPDPVGTPADATHNPVTLHSRPDETRSTPRHRVRPFLLTLNRLAGWTSTVDPTEIGPALTAQQWADFEATVTATVAFADAARQARHP